MRVYGIGNDEYVDIVLGNAILDGSFSTEDLEYIIEIMKERVNEEFLKEVQEGVEHGTST